MSGDSNGDAILRVDDLSIERRGSRVLDRTSFEVYRGERLGIVGDDAAGTSGLAHALLGEIPEGATVTGDVTYYPDAGDPIDVLRLGEKAARKFRWQNASLVEAGRTDPFNPTMRIRTHFEETLGAHRSNVGDGIERASRVLSAFDLDPDRILDAHPDDLTAGTRERATIALALVLRPKILVLDGVPSAFAPAADGSQFETLQSEYGYTGVVLGTALSAIEPLVTRIAVMYEGAIVETGSARKILKEPSHPYTRTLGDSGVRDP